MERLPSWVAEVYPSHLLISSTLHRVARGNGRNSILIRAGPTDTARLYSRPGKKLGEGADVRSKKHLLDARLSAAVLRFSWLHGTGALLSLMPIELRQTAA
jgi:hypothetical protein